MERTNFEKLLVYQISERLADEIWKIVLTWGTFEKNTIGSQLVRAIDSVGANIAEGTGRAGKAEKRYFTRIARGSLTETQHWLRRAYRRNLLTNTQTQILKDLLDSLAPKLNAYLRSMKPNHEKTP
ncbi:MAG TPA: four helix bundle protein [Acidobacteriota bacterium]|nr:four helix bundle protein [Acidobacteriota bacterium]